MDGPRATRRRAEPLILAGILAFGVVGWQQWLHVAVFDVQDHDGAQLAHWLRDGALAFLPALAAISLGLRLASRLDRSRRTAGALALRPACIAVVFGLALVPLVTVHGLIDDRIGGAEGVGSIEPAPGAGYLLADGPGGLEGAGGFWGHLAHALRDAAVALPVGFVLMAIALVATSWLAIQRDQAEVMARVLAPATTRIESGPAPSLGALTLTKRELLKYGGVGAAAVALSSSGLVVLSTRRAHAAPSGEAIPWLSDGIELYMNEGTVEMIDRTPVYSWGWGFRSGGVDDRTALHVPGPVLWTNHGELVELSVTNTLNEPHSFFIDGVVDSGPIPPGQTRALSFAAPPPGTYLYQDGLNRPVNRVLGLHGVLIVMPADGTLRPHPDLAPEHWTFVSQWVWVFNEIDPAFNARAQADLPIDPADFVARFKPRYFTINGRMGSLASHQETAPDTVVHDRIGNPALIRIVNAGVAMHAPHFHGNHVYPVLRNASIPQTLMFKDVVRLMPEDRIDVHLPFEIPPNAVQFPPDEAGRRFLEELHGRDIEGSWPMHCHVEMSQSAGGGLYPQGLLTDWKVEL